MFALFKWAEAQPKTTAVQPIFSLDFDLDNILSDSVEANPELRAAFVTALTRLGTDLNSVLAFEKANTTAKKAEIGVFGTNEVAERFFSEDAIYSPLKELPSGYGVVNPVQASSWAPEGEKHPFNWMNVDFLEAYANKKRVMSIDIDGDTIVR